MQFPFGPSYIYCIDTIGTSIFVGAGTGNYGSVYLSVNADTNWVNPHTGLPNNPVQSIAINGSNIFAGTYGSGVYISTNNGANWSSVNNGLTNPYVLSLAVYGINIFAGTMGGIFLSTNNGANWTNVNNGSSISWVRSIAINGTDIFIGGSYGACLSSNNGASWTTINNGFPSNNTVYALAFSGNSLFAGTANGLFNSTNNGANWTLVSNLPIDDFRSLAIYGTKILAGSNGSGIFLSADNGLTWSTFNDGLMTGDNIVISLAINNSNIFAGTGYQSWGGLVYKRPLSDIITGFEETNNIKEMNIFPNPATDKLQIEASQISEIEILNLEGQIIKSISANENHETIDVSSFTRGMYFIKVKSGEGIAVKKFVKE